MMFYDYAMLLKDDGKIDEAIHYLKKAADVEVNHLIEHELGHLYFRKQDYKSALQWYQAALASSGNPRHVLWDIAKCHSFLQDYRECAVVMMECLLFDPFHVEGWNNLAVSLNHIGLRHLYEAIAPIVAEAGTPQQLSIGFDELVIRMFPKRKQKWLVFQDFSSQDDDSHC